MTRMILTAALAFALACGTAFAQNAPPAANATRTLDIYWIDTEGGAATLIVSPTGRVAAGRCRLSGRRP